MSTHSTPQTFANDSHQAIDRSADKAHQVVTQATSRADQAITATQDTAAHAEQSVQAGLRQIREAVPATMSRAVTQAEDLARAGIHKARAAGQSVAHQASTMRDQTVSYVREEPTKALLMAAAAGACATLLIGWATRGNNRHASR
jgi:ElaB/YqjD/DUF883 family membrane-anchored ribosome-binding protein